MNWRIVYLSVFSIILMNSVTAQIKGVVTDATTSEPLMGASVVNVTTGKGAITSQEGTFSIQADVGDVLAVAYTGFRTEEVTISAATPIAIRLEQGVLLDEVVVTGYSIDTRRKTPGSVSTIKARDLQIAPSGNVEQQLQGRVSGLSVISNGQPGTTSQVRVRGYGALGGNRPLYVVDGVPVSSVDFLSPGDIAGATVLKDASAASIYGARAAGGVIVYTTRKGTSGKRKMQVTYDALFGVTSPESGPSVLTPQEQAEWTWRAIRNAATIAGLSPEFNHPQYGSGPNPVLPDYLLVGPNAGVIGTVNLDDHRELYNIDPEAGPIYQVVKANKEGTNWYDAITRRGLTNRHHLGFSGAGERSRYYLSIGMQEQEGILKHQKFSRYSFRANTDFEVLPFLRFGENIQLTYSSKRIILGSNGGIGLAGEGGFISGAYRTAPILPLYDEFGGYAGTAAPGIGFSGNQLARLDRSQDNRDFTVQAFGNVFLELEPAPGFRLKSSFGGQFSTHNTRTYFKKTYETAANNTAAGFNQFSGYLAQWVWTNTADYQTTLGLHHNLEILVGQEVLDQGTGYDILGSGIDPFSENIDFIGLSTVNSRTVEGSRVNGVRFSSYFTRLNYDFADKYLLSLIVRRDGSSRFGSNRRFGTFPAFSAAWRLSSENFMKGATFLEDLKLRGGYGIMGNSNNVDPNNQFSLFGTTLAASSYDIGGTNSGAAEGFYRTRIGNSSARWEKAITTNIGIDALLFDGKLDIGLEFWRKETEDLLFRMPVTVQTGFFAAAPFVNVGKMLNRGIDWVTAVKGRNGALAYEVILNGSFLSNKIVALAPNIDNLPNRSIEINGIRPVLNQVGQPLSAFYGYVVQGIFQDQQEVDSAPLQEGAAPGRFRFKDINGDGLIDPSDRTNIGNPIADFTGGLACKLAYRNFELEVYSYASLGNEIYNISRNFTDFYNPGSAMSERVRQSWTKDNPDTTIPIYENTSNFSTNTQSLSYYVEDGSYFRLQNITFSYLLPALVLHRRQLDSARLFVSVNNAFTITGYTGLDPSVGGAMDTNFGIDRGNFPITRSWAFGVNLSF